MKELENGYVALFRQFLDWEWYDDANTMRLFIHCLLLANYKDKKWRGRLIKRGSFITSQPKLANSLKLSIMQIRNSLTKLKRTGEITVSTHPDYSIITVLSYNEYQNKQQSKRQSNNRANEQASNSLTTTTNNSNKEINTISNINNSSSSSLSKEDEEILKNLAKKNKIKYFRPWLRKITTNGDWVELLQKEKQRLQAVEEKKARETEQKANEIIPPADAKEEKQRIEQIQKEIRAKRRRH